jgi:hypothetical protein
MTHTDSIEDLLAEIRIHARHLSHPIVAFIGIMIAIVGVLKFPEDALILVTLGMCILIAHIVSLRSKSNRMGSRWMESSLWVVRNNDIEIEEKKEYFYWITALQLIEVYRKKPSLTTAINELKEHDGAETDFHQWYDLMMHLALTRHELDTNRWNEEQA